MQGKRGATGASGHRGARGATGRRGRIGKAGPKGPRGLQSSHSKEVLDQFVINFDDVYRQLNGVLKLIGQMQSELNKLAAKADALSIVSPKA